MRIIFLGTPEFAVNCLDMLIKSKHEVVAVVTQPDKPSERGNKVVFSPVKEYALKNGIPLFQFPKISRDGIVDLKALSPDLMITAAYGQILSQQVLDIAKFGTINVHASILPKYRGASPIQSAIIHGDTETGVTVMKTEIGLDTGDIIAIAKTKIGENETAGELTNKLSIIGGNLLLDVIDRLEDGSATFVKQEHVYATITKKIDKEDAVINWEKSSREIKCLILGTNPNPISRTYLNNMLVKVYRAKVADIDISPESMALAVGTVLPESSPKRGLFVKTADGAIEILEIQLPGTKILSGKDVLNGRKVSHFDVFKNLEVRGG
ncbi:MAG: methionyl-tRNA formyltransferase [Clostridia bacterium]|nr:methionyl-tRNA formyltransferase [Clostridia bacterium]